MSFPHILLAIIVAFLWGINFIFIKWGLRELSPLFFCTLRFLLASLPLIFFIKPPAIPLRILVMYGIIMFALQFLFLFLGMNAGMTAGMSALVMQVQIFFSLFLAMLFLKETPNLWQLLGALVSFGGIAMVAMHLNDDMPLISLLFILAAAATLGSGNLITKKVKDANMIALVIWGCFVASIPMLLLTVFFEGPASMLNSLQHLTIHGGISLAYVVCMSTWVAYGAWSFLISYYPVSVVVPFTLLVPVFSTISAALWLDEPVEKWALWAGLFVISGLYINIAGSRWLTLKKMNPV